MLKREGVYIVTPNEAKKIRKSLGWSAARLADYMHVHQDTVHKWESGNNPIKGPAVVVFRMLLQKIEKKKLALATEAK